MSGERVLVLDDEKLIRWSVREKLQGEGYTVAECETAAEALRRLAEDDFDLLLLDYRLPDMTGMEVLQKVRQGMPELSVVMMTAYGTVENAVQALKLGAFDYLTKPVNPEELVAVVEKALEATRLRREVRRLRTEQRTQEDGRLVGESPAVRAIHALVEKIATSQASIVLLEGESGTGKNLVARAIHYGSPRADRAFVTITCSAIPDTLLESELFGHERGSFTDAKTAKKGLLEMAEGGTVFLDEIGELGPAVQAKLLRFLEDRMIKRVGGLRDIKIDVRVIAATNRNLEDEVREGRFREDLYYRLKVIPILLPPLRERREDIPLLVSHFLAHYNREFHKSTARLSKAAMDRLVDYPWYGNVRELRNVIERVMILEDKEEIVLEDLPEGIRLGVPSMRPSAHGAGATDAPVLGGKSLDEMERDAIAGALEQCGRNQVRAARLLGISRDTLRYRMKKYGIGEPHGEAGHG